MSFDLDRIAVETMPCHWIERPNGDEGHEWCRSCGRAEARHLRRHDRKRKRDYHLDGGFRIEHDHMPVCHGCGAWLDGSLTTYGALEEIDCYRQHGLSSNPAIDALCLGEIIRALEFNDKHKADFRFAVFLGELVLKRHAGGAAACGGSHLLRA